MEGQVKSSPYIVNSVYDSVFFIFCPLLALLFGYLFSIRIAYSDNGVIEFFAVGREKIFYLLYTPFIFAHLILVLFRSHLNTNIFKLYPFRFSVIPVILFLSMLLNNWMLVLGTALAIWWDVYHSSLQTFGLARIYDRKQNNDPTVGRRLDYWLNLVIYAGPVLAGATLVQTVALMNDYGLVQTAFFKTAPAYVNSSKKYITWTVITVGILYIIYYVFAYWRLHQKGYRISLQKVLLLESTAVCTLIAWGFNSVGDAFFIVNFFHALQYFALVWWSERKNIVAKLYLQKIPFGMLIAFIIMVGATFSYGIWVTKTLAGNLGKTSLAIITLISILHFWYDGFIWSVRKKQI